jgi:hypothetical protein
MTPQPLVDVQFPIELVDAAFSIEVRIRSLGDRWMSVADIAGERQVGLGRNPREALEAALVSLGERMTKTLLADLRLLAPSVDIARQQRKGASSRS